MFWLTVMLLRAFVAESAIWQLSVEPASLKKLFSSLVSASVPLRELMWMLVADPDCRSSTLQGGGDLRGGLALLTDVEKEVSESPVQDDEEFGELCIDVVG